MEITRFSESQIFAVLKQADAGMPIKDICRQAILGTETKNPQAFTLVGL